MGGTISKYLIVPKHFPSMLDDEEEEDEEEDGEGGVGKGGVEEIKEQ